ncbi:hypothetical protein R3P38DRAFT_2990347 [Favolaschia claudopus]|uniref:Secreted protein n=1 Tax=Favolaschia claudopus TaxID=2862362 RepID=A0AAW0AV34_9AGAR
MQYYLTWVCALVATSCVFFLHYAVSLNSIYVLTFHSPTPSRSHPILLRLRPSALLMNLPPVPSRHAAILCSHPPSSSSSLKHHYPFDLSCSWTRILARTFWHPHFLLEIFSLPKPTNKE